MMDRILDKHIPRYSDTSDTAGTVGNKLLSKNAFMAPIAEFMQSWTSQAVAAEPITTEMKKLMELHKFEADPSALR